MTTISDELRELDLPVLIIRGDQDPFLSPEVSEWLKREVPDSRLVNIELASHFVQEDEPELLAHELRTFFMKASRGR